MGERSDHDLLDLIRAGDDSAYAELWSRHYDTAVRAAQECERGGGADDVATEALTRLLAAMCTERRPVAAFRPYVLRAVANLAQARRQQDGEVAGDVADLDRIVPASDPALEGTHRSVAVRAYQRLRPEYRHVLWYVDVEGLTPAEAARYLGKAPAAARSLASRAQADLRREFVQVQLGSGSSPSASKRTVEQLGGYVRGPLHPRDHHRVELTMVERSLRAGLVPLVLGTGQLTTEWLVETGPLAIGQVTAALGPAAAGTAIEAGEAAGPDVPDATDAAVMRAIALDAAAMTTTGPDAGDIGRSGPGGLGEAADRGVSYPGASEAGAPDAGDADADDTDQGARDGAVTTTGGWVPAVRAVGTGALASTTGDGAGVGFAGIDAVARLRGASDGPEDGPGGQPGGDGGELREGDGAPKRRTGRARYSAGATVPAAKTSGGRTGSRAGALVAAVGVAVTAIAATALAVGPWSSNQGTPGPAAFVGSTTGEERSGPAGPVTSSRTGPHGAVVSPTSTPTPDPVLLLDRDRDRRSGGTPEEDVPEAPPADPSSSTLDPTTPAPTSPRPSTSPSPTSRPTPSPTTTPRPTPTPTPTDTPDPTPTDDPSPDPSDTPTDDPSPTPTEEGSSP